MIRYPQSTASQQPLLAPLNGLVSQVPACEDWISFLQSVEPVYDSLSTGAIQNLDTIAGCLANVFDYLYTASSQSVYSSQYLLKLSISARQVALSSSLYAQLASGSINIVLTQSAQTALATLQAWDPVLGYQVPSDTGQLATTLIEGASLQ